jgi:hypothetical protein
MITDAQYQAWLKQENVQRVLLVEANYYDSVSPVGAGLKEATTNLVASPNVFSGWSKQATATVVGNNDLRFPAGGDYIYCTLPNRTIGEYYSASIELMGSGTVLVDLFSTTGSTPVVVSLSLAMQRITLTQLATSADAVCYFRVGRISGTTATQVTVQNAQVEKKAYSTAFTATTRAASGYENTLYMATLPFVSSVNDTPSNQPYDDVIMDTPKFSCALSDALEGYTIPSWGDILIENSEFMRDIWLNYGWDGRKISILFGDPSWPRSDFRPVMTGTISGIAASNTNQLKMSIKDKQWSLNRPIQSNLIGAPTLITGLTYKVSDDTLDSVDIYDNPIKGSIDAVWDNGVKLSTSAYTTSPSTAPATFTLLAPPAGLLSVDFTGGPNTVGQVVPLCYGLRYNITPVVLSASLLMYQVHEGAIKRIIEVRDGGIPIQFAADLANGKFTLLSKPVGQITCDVEGALLEGVYVEGTGRIFRCIALTKSDLTNSDIDYTSLSSFVDLCTQSVGIYISTRRNTLDVLDELMKSVGGFYTPNRKGQLIFGRMDTPATYALPKNSNSVKVVEAAVNTIINPRFATDLSSWAVSNGTTANGAITRITDDGAEGDLSCLQYSLTTTGSWAVLNNTYVTGKTAPYFDVTKTYTLSFWIKYLLGTVNNLNIAIVDSNGTNFVMSSRAIISKTPSQWTKVSFTFIPAIAGVTPVIQFINGSNIKTCRIGRVQLEINDHATDFTATSRSDGYVDLDLTADDVSFGTLKVAKQSVPWQTARLGYLANGTVQTTTHGAVTDTNKVLYSQAWQYTKRMNPSVRVSHLLAAEPVAKNTCLNLQPEALSETDRLLNFNDSVHTTYTLDCATLPLTLNMGDVIRLTHYRYNLQSGKLVNVVGINESIANRKLSLTLRD